MKNKKGIFILIEGISGSGKTTLANLLLDYFKSLGIEAVLNSEPTEFCIFGKAIRKIIEKKKVCEDSDKILFLNELMRKIDEINIKNAGVFIQGNEIVADFRKIIVSGVKNAVFSKSETTEEERQSFFIADRFFDLSDFIIPNLKKGICVIQDRFDLSTMAYGSAFGLKIEDIYKWHLHILGKYYIYPDFSFFVNTPPLIASDRLLKSGKIIDIHEKLEDLKKINDKYKCAINFMKKQFSLVGKPKRKIHIINGDETQSVVLQEVKEILKDFVKKEKNPA